MPHFGKTVTEETANGTNVCVKWKLLNDESFVLRISAPSKGKSVPVIDFTGCIFDLRDPDIVDICDTENAEMGEIAFQLLTPCDGRVPIDKCSTGLFCSQSSVYDVELLSSPGLIESGIEAFLAQFGEDYMCNSVIFAYLGNDGMIGQDKWIFNAAQQNSLDTLRCFNGLNCDEGCYIVVKRRGVE